MFTEYYFSKSYQQWIVADKATGSTLAHFDQLPDITAHFLPAVIEHNRDICGCNECTDGRLNEVGDYIEGGYGDAFA